MRKLHAHTHIYEKLAIENYNATTQRLYKLEQLELIKYR